MGSLDDPQNIIGMGAIFVDENDDGINIEEIEQSIIMGVDSIQKKDDEVDFVEQYESELKALTDTTTPAAEDDLLNWSPPGITSAETQHVSNTTEDLPTINETSSIDHSAGTYDTNNYSAPPITSSSGYNNFNSGSSSSSGNSSGGYVNETHSRPAEPWSASNPDDSQLNYMTNEERKQSHINSVLGNMDDITDDMKFIKEEEAEDEMARIFEQIDLLKTNLEAEGVNLDRIPNVDPNTSRKEARSILRILQIKNDRLRYCDMFEECILAGAYGLESMFDGKKEWFGAKIDLVGWPETVKVKLRRMRYDTSSFVSNIMTGYSVSHGWRIMFELLPSLFLYSRDRRLRTHDTLISDNAYHDALQNLNS